MVRAALLALICILVSHESFAAGNGRRYFGPPTVVGVLSSSLINESSGIAASRRYANQFYSHNDSGDIARFFRVNSAGAVQAEIRLNGVTANDWEDIASGWWDGKDYIFVGDIGDNNESRSSIRIFRWEEALVSGVSTTTAFQTYTLTYPDGPHNAGTLMIDPKRWEGYIVTKVSSGPSGIYRFKIPSSGGTYSLSKVGMVALPLTGSASPRVTAGDISPDGRHVVLRTLNNMYEYESTRAVGDWWKGAPIAFASGSDPQGEAICYDAVGHALYTTSEGANTAIYRFAITDSPTVSRNWFQTSGIRPVAGTLR